MLNLEQDRLRRSRRFTYVLVVVAACCVAAGFGTEMQLRDIQLDGQQVMRRQQAVYESLTLERRWQVDRLAQATARLH